MLCMEIRDARGRQIPEAVLRMSKEEVTNLLVETSQVDDGTKEHALIRDQSGTTLAIYVETQEPPPLDRHTDWWAGPLILFLILLVLMGAFTLARGIVSLLF